MLGRVSRRWGVAAAAVVLVGALSAVGYAQQGQGQGRGFGPRGRGMGPMGRLGIAAGQLDLTDAQRQQIRGIVENHRQEMQQLGERTRTARQALRQATETEPFNENAVRTASAGLSEVMADGAVLRAKVRAEVMQVLTPEQRAKAAELKARAAERQEQRKQRMEQRRQQRSQPKPQGGV